jgi:hypothetical protein
MKGPLLPELQRGQVRPNKERIEDEDIFESIHGTRGGWRS